jgi:hypothetical protein
MVKLVVLRQPFWKCVRQSPKPILIAFVQISVCSPFSGVLGGMTTETIVLVIERMAGGEEGRKREELNQFPPASISESPQRG